MPRFRKKPVEVSAEVFAPNPEQHSFEQKPWPDGVYEARRVGSGSKPFYHIETLEGVHVVSPGDVVITGIKGEKYPCKPDIFAASYDPLDEDSYDMLMDMGQPNSIEGSHES